MKRLACLLLAFFLVLGLLPAAHAAKLPFRDVEAGSWYREAVEYVYTNGLMNGTGDGVFSPDTNMSRGMIVTVLHRLEGSPASSAKIPFGDVRAEQYFYNAVVWSYENGIVNGTSGNIFSPDNNVTREQLVTIFFRYANAKGYDTAKRIGLSGYADAGVISGYALEALQWAVSEGIITGMDATTLAPDGPATRAQFATIIQRFVAWTEAQTEVPEPTETEPVPTETEPKPTEEEPEPTEEEPEPTEEEPEPTEEEPEPTEEEPEPTEEEPEPTEEEPEPTEEEPEPTEEEPKPTEEEPEPTEEEPEPTESEPQPTETEPRSPATVLSEEKDAELRENLQTAIDNILYAETEIVHSDTFIPGKTYTGTAYYFSNDGDDSNDGLTPETAWQSVGKMLEVLNWGDILKPGDAIFLRRGDIFRLPEYSLTVSVDGITMSAYGEGDKPILTCSTEDGSGMEKWKLVYEDETGKKIWQFYKDVRDTSMVILNDGQAIAERVYEFYGENGYVSCLESGWWMHDAEGVTPLDHLLPLEEALTEDLTFISRPARYDSENSYNGSDYGPLYLRCDLGNPGQVCGSIEFTELIPTAIIWLEASDCVFDNISMRCNGSAYMKSNIDSNQIHWSEYENTVIQNCEFAYGGGGVWQYESREDGTHAIVAQGDGIYTIIKNTTIRNNYFHDALASTATFEWSWEDERTSGGYYHVLDNVMVNTLGMSFNSEPTAVKYLDSLIVRGNQVWNTGRWDNGKILYSGGSLSIVNNYYGEYIVENNVFYGTELSHESNALLHVTIYSPNGVDSTCPVIRDNTYVQYSGRKLGYFPMWGENDQDLYIDDPYLLAKAAEITGDTTSSFYITKYKAEDMELEPVPQTPATVLSEEKDKELRENLQTAIDNILYAETEIVHSDTFIPGKTYTGTAYYVSNDGDDSNDGLTPETAWQSMGKLLGALGGWDNAVQLQPGDAVFLRRGDVFRLTDWSLSVPVDQITFSAYGEGDKPILTCSSENGTGGEKWELVYSDESGKKIWKYYRDMKDVSMVILNDGEALTKRVYEFYDGNQYLSCEATGWWMHEDEGVTLLGGLLPLEESMTEDLDLISRPERTSVENNYSDCGDGPLYLRCDGGNPGELYGSIEFSEYLITGVVWLEASDVVFDNISLRCNGNSFIKADTRSNQEDFIHWSEYENTVIQNCEFAFGGGCVTSYHISPSGKVTVEAQGDGIYTVVKNTTIRNNYFHDMMSSTATFEWCEDDTYSDGYFHVVDNVMVNTNGIRLDSGAVTLQYLDSIIIRGNQVWNNGKLDNGKIIYAEASLALLGDHYGECIVEKNVFYGTEIGHENNALFYIDRYTQIEGLRDPACTDPIIRNNIYVQYSGRKLAYFPMWQDYSLEQGGTNLYMEDPYLQTRMAEVTGDTTSEFYVIESSEN